MIRATGKRLTRKVQEQTLSRCWESVMRLRVTAGTEE